jgi:hypothetical protein
MKSKRELIRDRAVVLALDGMATETAITTALWEWSAGPSRSYDAEDHVRVILELRAAIERAMNPTLVKPVAPRLPGSIVPAPAPGWSIDGRRLIEPPTDTRTGFRPTDGRVVRALFDASRRMIGRNIPPPAIDPRCILWAVAIWTAKYRESTARRRAEIASRDILAAKGWKIAVR